MYIYIYILGRGGMSPVDRPWFGIAVAEPS